MLPVSACVRVNLTTGRALCRAWNPGTIGAAGGLVILLASVLKARIFSMHASMPASSTAAPLHRTKGCRQSQTEFGGSDVVAARASMALENLKRRLAFHAQTLEALRG